MSICETTPELRPVAFDVYRDILKAIRAELFAVTVEAGSVDPGDGQGIAAVAVHVRDVVRFLTEHAEHEDAVDTVLRSVSPALADEINGDHEVLEARMATLVELAEAAHVAPVAEQRWALHRLYIELAAFTSDYLAHQDREERIVMPALEAAVGVPGVIAIHEQIVTTMPPEQLFGGLALMLPAMNIDDRTEMLGGMQAGAPAEVFNQLWSLACSVLPATDAAALASRLGRN